MHGGARGARQGGCAAETPRREIRAVGPSHPGARQREDQRFRAEDEVRLCARDGGGGNRSRRRGRGEPRARAQGAGRRRSRTRRDAAKSRRHAESADGGGRAAAGEAREGRRDGARASREPRRGGAKGRPTRQGDHGAQAAGGGPRPRPRQRGGASRCRVGGGGEGARGGAEEGGRAAPRGANQAGLPRHVQEDAQGVGVGRTRRSATLGTSRAACGGGGASRAPRDGPSRASRR